MTRTKLQMLLVVMIVCIIGLSASFLLLPPPEGAEGTIFYSPLGGPVTLAESLFGVGSALLFFMARRHFKHELKPAYWLLAFGTFASGILTLIIPYIEYNGLWGNQFFVTLSYLPYFLIALFMFLGVRVLYKKLGLKGWVTSFPVIAAIVLVAWLAYNFIPHVDTWADLPEEWMYDAAQLLTVTPAILINAALFMAVRAYRRTGRDYRLPFGLLALGIFFEAIALTTATYLQIIGYDNWYFNTRAYETPYILATMSYLASGYFFMRIGLPRAVSRAAEEDVTSMDIVAYIAGKVSDSSDIDPYLDKMRVITARLAPGERPSEEDERTLQSVYTYIEKHLITSDPLRTFTQKEIRDDIRRHFGLSENNNRTFWSKLS